MMTRNNFVFQKKKYLEESGNAFGFWVNFVKGLYILRNGHHVLHFGVS